MREERSLHANVSGVGHHVLFADYFLCIVFTYLPWLLFAFSFGRLRGRVVFKWIPVLINYLSLFLIAVYPGVYDPVYAMSCCILAIVFASAFALILPLIAPAVTLLLLLTLIGRCSADHFLILILWFSNDVLGWSNSTPVPRWLRLWTHKVAHGGTRAIVHVAKICASSGASATGSRANSAQPAVVAGSGGASGNLAYRRTLCGAVL